MTTRLLATALLAAAALMSSTTLAADREKRGVPVKSGDVAPDFTLADQGGRSHTLSTERGKRQVVLVFYRGHW